MTISKEVLDQLLSTIDDETFRDKVAEALTRESTELAEVRGQLNDLVAFMGEVEVDELRAAQPETLRREVDDLEVSMAGLLFAFNDLVETTRAIADG